jgi:hypothetical protein
MELGKALRTIVVEPLEDPAPADPKHQAVAREAEALPAEEECALPTTPAR